MRGPLQQTKPHGSRAVLPRGLRVGGLDSRRIVYNSFQGRFSDNPRAIYEELARRTGDLSHVWMAGPTAAEAFPAGTRALVPGGPDWFGEVDDAKFIVANVEMRDNLVKRPGMVFLQTWHGTTLKRIGYDNRYVHANPGPFERDVDEYRRWDYVISPNRFTSSIVHSAFRGFEGEILETGYPRNDALNAPDRDEVRARVRAKLGIEEGQKAVLYAPTWRDNLVHEEGPGGFRLALDIEELARRFGDDHVFLMRLHFLVAAELGDAYESVRNVSAHEDIRELYLAADVLITDYSSVMFDFAITGKPMVFFAYDLEHYRDELRGFYFDFEAEAPGPLCRTTDEVLSVLEDVDAALAPYGERYEAWKAKFTYLDDGRASARVVERVFSELL